MGGGLMQLVAYGAQDIYLTGNPEITFFKAVYRRHTNFSMEAIEQTFNGTADFGKKVAATISRNGDLIGNMYVQVTLPDAAVADGAKFAWTRNAGYALLKSIELEVGGQRIDKHYSEWLYLWAELSRKQGHVSGLDNMVGNAASLNNDTAPAGQAGTHSGSTLYVPLAFWFCRNPGLALPLIALQYHEVKVNIEFRELSGMFNSSAADGLTAGATTSSLSLGSAVLYVDYIYLDTDERRRFAQSSHEYLIEQVQFTGNEAVSSASAKVKLNFNHPVKELVWVYRLASSDTHTQWFNFTDSLGASAAGVTVNGDLSAGSNPVATAKLQLNGHDRFAERPGDYFNLVQCYQHHSNVPSTGVCVYSFSLNPENHQPSGTCNFSRIDNATLSLTFGASASANLQVYAVNYNVLRVMGGMGGLAYSN